MGFRLTCIVQAKRVLQKSILASSQEGSTTVDIPKGCLAVYAGETLKKRFVVRVTYLNQPAFQELLGKAEEEFGFNHPMGGLTIPCSEETFVDLTSRLN